MIMTTIIDCRPKAATPDLKVIKAKQQVAWSSGDYAIVGTTLQIVGEQLAEAMDLRAGQTVLDIAAGNGNFTLAAARRWCDVTSTDYVESLLQRGRQRADAEGLLVKFQKADAEDLPFADESFDAVASTFGGMFSPDQSRTASEMLRVCRSGGRIGLANWTPAGLKSPALWGTREWMERAFRAASASLIAEPRHFVFRYRSAQHFLDVFCEFYGPMLKAFEALNAAGRKALSRDIIELIGRSNKSGDKSMVVPSEYLEVIITKR
jgi:ubiquinone/menaquinone biosynthesis C-methylase UbiE